MAPCRCNSYYFSSFNELSFVVSSFVLTMDTYSQEGMYQSLSKDAGNISNELDKRNKQLHNTDERTQRIYVLGQIQALKNYCETLISLINIK